MKLEATARLRQHEVDAVTWEQYSQVIAGLDPSVVVAFSFPIPSVLKGLTKDLSEIAEHLKGVGVGFADVVKAFKEKSIFKLLKGVGFTVSKLLHAVKSAVGLPGQALFHAMADLAEVFKDTKFLKSLKPAERLAKLEEIIKRHPVLTKVTGVVVAGLLILMFLKSSFTGHLDHDLSLVDSVLDALKGDFDLADMLTSQDGLYSIAVLLFGVATGGTSIVSYGSSALWKLADFIDDNAYSLLLALFYSAAKKLRMHYTKDVPAELHSSRTQEWLDKKAHEGKHEYFKKYPGSKFRTRPNLVNPNKDAK